MNTLASFLIVYLIGLATPIFLFRITPAMDYDKSGQWLLNFVFIGIGFLIFLVLYAWRKQGFD